MESLKLYDLPACIDVMNCVIHTVYIGVTHLMSIYHWLHRNFQRDKYNTIL